MADWIWNTAERGGISKIEIDILNDKVSPRELQITPIVTQLIDLRQTIQKTLSVNNFPEDFIVEAKFTIDIQKKDGRWFTCVPTVKDKDGREYLGKTYWEQAMEREF